MEDKDITSRIHIFRSLHDLLHQENMAMEHMLYHEEQMIQSLHTLATVNHYYHQQTNTLKLSLEAMRRQVQFKLGTG